jgi:hypothetical protein
LSSSGHGVQDLAEALRTIFEAKNEIKIIGTRHGEKLYESLVVHPLRVVRGIVVGGRDRRLAGGEEL